jgi:hypothetical protein
MAAMAVNPEMARMSGWCVPIVFMSGCAARQPVVNASEAHVGTVAGTGLAGNPEELL